jgi:hypothetical protein
MVRQPFHCRRLAVQAAFGLASLRRAASAAAAAPNSSTIGGAGTGAGGPPDDPGGPEGGLWLPLDVQPPLDDQPPLVLHPLELEP